MTATAATQLLHWSDGRVRLKNRILRKSPDLARRIETTLRDTVGIRDVQANTTTSSLLVEYDAAAWRDPEATHGLWKALCELFPDNCSKRECTIPVGELSQFPTVRKAIIEVFTAAQGVTDVKYDDASQTLHVQFDPQRFALEPVLRSLTGKAAGSF